MPTIHIDDGVHLTVQPGGAVLVWSDRLCGWAPVGTTPKQIETMRARAVGRFGEPLPRVVTEGKRQ